MTSNNESFKPFELDSAEIDYLGGGGGIDVKVFYDRVTKRKISASEAAKLIKERRN